MRTTRRLIKAGAGVAAIIAAVPDKEAGDGWGRAAGQAVADLLAMRRTGEHLGVPPGASPWVEADAPASTTAGERMYMKDQSGNGNHLYFAERAPEPDHVVEHKG